MRVPLTLKVITWSNSLIAGIVRVLRANTSFRKALGKTVPLPPRESGRQALISAGSRVWLPEVGVGECQGLG